MKPDLAYRNEQKYLINQKQEFILKRSLHATTEIDSHGESSGYMVNSLYFDSPSNSAQTEKFQGLLNRRKIRLRYYSNNLDIIKLESKLKYGEFVKKEYIHISKEEALNLIDGNFTFLKKRKCSLSNDFYRYFQSQLLRPKIIIKYNRLAFTKKINSVRITFDSCLCSSKRFDLFFKKNINMRQIFFRPTTVLEVKFNGWLPEVLKKQLSIANLSNRNSVSKFTWGRSKYLYS